MANGLRTVEKVARTRATPPTSTGSEAALAGAILQAPTARRHRGSDRRTALVPAGTRVADEPSGGVAARHGRAPPVPGPARRRHLADPRLRQPVGSQVVPRLAGLTAGELEAVRRYEESGDRGRRTILEPGRTTPGRLSGGGRRPPATGEDLVGPGGASPARAIAELTLAGVEARCGRRGEAWAEPVEAWLPAALDDDGQLLASARSTTTVVG